MRSRLAQVCALASLAILILGLGIEVVRFGLSQQASIDRIERDVRQRVADAQRRTETLAGHVARQGRLVADAMQTRERVPALFARLAELSRPVGGNQLAATVYVPVGPAGQYRVLAWSEGPAEDLPSDQLAAPPATFLAPGAGGLRLVSTAGIDQNSGRVGIATAETRLAREPLPGSGRYEIVTDLGPVSATPLLADPGALSQRPNRFVVTAADGRPLLEVDVSLDALAERRALWRTRVFAVAAVPLVIWVLLSSGRLIERRHDARTLRSWLLWSVATSVVVAGAALFLAWLVDWAGGPVAVTYTLTALAALAVVVLLVVSYWWRPGPRASPQGRRARFVLEQLGGGVVLATSMLMAARVLSVRIAPATLETWQYPLLPFEWSNLLYLSGLLVIQLAIGWTAACALAILAERWRLDWRDPGRTAAAAGLWLVPSAFAVLWWPAAGRAAPLTAWMTAAFVAIWFGIVAVRVRRRYRRTSQAMRLLMLFAALLIPPMAFYPMAAVFAEDAARTLVETEYGPLTAQLPRRLLSDLRQTQRDIDALNLRALVSGTPRGAGPVAEELAFEVWKDTSLARTRATSEIELYGQDRRLLSHFALNVPELDPVTSPSPGVWNGTNCDWTIFAEGVRFGAEERTVFNAERGICDDTGALEGAIVVRVALDYSALPFVISTSPSYDVLGDGATPRPVARLRDLQVVVYGWSLHPLFTSSTVAWPITQPIFQRLYASRDPFWAEDLPAGGVDYDVYFQSDRASIFAVGYPVPTLRDHATRLAEIAAVMAGLYVALLAGAAAYAPFVRRRMAPLRVLFDEIRRSFHRKIFLFFVLAAVGPVFLFAIAFGAYMTDQLREDVEREAVSVVEVARRVFQEIAAALPGPDGPRPTPTDDVMVWIRQVIDQDVNLYVGAQLAATSQRDLFRSGVLPTRTPAAVYREVVLNRLPTDVEENLSGAFQYLVAAAAVPAIGPEAVLTVPLALRQQEIEREIDELNRGVLVGAVLVVLFAANLGAAVAGKFSDRVASLTRATRLIAAGRLDVRVPVDTADELGRLGDDFNTMSATLAAQRAELARTNQIKAWAEMARQVAHEIKNPLTPIQLAAEHLQRVHDDQRRPLGRVFDQCVSTVLRQVKLLRQIASEFANFAADPEPRPAELPVQALLDGVLVPYQFDLANRIHLVTSIEAATPPIWADRTLVARALTNLVENAVQAMPSGGALTVTAGPADGAVRIVVEDTGVGMDAESMARAFEPYFSTKTAGSGLGLANAKRNIERSGGSIALDSTPGVGTRVSVTLPAAMAATAPDHGAPSPE